MKLAGQGKGVARKVTVAVILIAFIVYTFLSFSYTNHERIVSQNTEYISDAADQKSQRMEYILRDAQKNLSVLANLYGKTLTDDSVDYDELAEMAESAPFDYIEFVDRDGMNRARDGEAIDASDREYFKRGMEGESGIDAVLDSKISDNNVLVFYAPLKFQDEIIGVITGLYEEEQLEELLYSSYFGRQSRTFLCTRDGDVIAGSADEEIPDNIISYYGDNDYMTQEQVQEMEEALTEMASYSFRYKGSAGPGTAYITDINGTDFMIFQAFPSSITQSMINKANAAGAVLMTEIVAALVLYIMVILLLDYRQKKRLLRENTQMSYVISGMTKLFDRFILVDLEHGTYQYLAGTRPQTAPIPEAGEYPQLSGYLASLLVGEEEKEKLGEELRIENIRKGLGESTTSLTYEYYIHREQEQWESLSIVCLKRREGAASQVLFARQDVTEAKTEELRKNAALQEAFRAAEAANGAKTDFLSRMSHDIRTPMNAIMGMTAIAAMHADDPARVTDCLNKITVSSRHLLGIINEVLDMSKIESGKLALAEEEFSLSETIEDLVTIFHPQIEQKKQDFNISIEGMKHERVIGDSQRLSQIFVNIMGNAVKFTPEGGRITLKITERPTKNTTPSSVYEFVFADTGIGMDEEFVSHVFEPFARAKDSSVGHTEGTGLGMSITRNIVQMMGGNIQVKSKPGVGSEFTVSVYLRLCGEDEENVDCLADLAVLVVDDEVYACEHACQVLDSIGMAADWVTDGDSAIARLLEAKEKGEDYTAVILDWKMPGKDGLETAAEIRQKIGWDIPIIILSAYDWSAIEHEARAIGVDDFISKPLFKSRLIYVMKNLVEQRPKLANPGEAEEVQRNFEGKRALLVEDNDLNAEIAQELLAMAGFEVETACDGREAVTYVSASAEGYYDLILMDIQMPNMNGYEATAAIRALERADVRSMPIIAMSANAFADDIQKSRESGMNDHVAKPVEFEKLTATLSKWLG